MSETKPVSYETDFTPQAVDSKLVEAVQLTQAYRAELTALDAYLKEAKNSNLDVARFDSNMER